MVLKCFLACNQSTMKNVRYARHRHRHSTTSHHSTTNTTHTDHTLRRDELRALVAAQTKLATLLFRNIEKWHWKHRLASQCFTAEHCITVPRNLPHVCLTRRSRRWCRSHEPGPLVDIGRNARVEHQTRLDGTRRGTRIHSEPPASTSWEGTSRRQCSGRL